MDRRQFLIGSGTVLSATFLAQATNLFNRENQVIPLIEDRATTETLYFVDNGYDYELRLGLIDLEVPQLTLREALERYYQVKLPQNRPMKLSEYRELYSEFGIKPSELDEAADSDWIIPGWARSDSPNAMAYRRLENLDLSNYSENSGRLIGGLNFIDGYNPANDYLGVRADDGISASLLQGRLLELGENIRVEIVKG